MSLYRELQVSPHATNDEIKKAYYKLVTIYHPDKNPDGEDKFLKITDAYKVLSSKRDRELYDKTLRGTNPSILNHEKVYDPKTHDFIRFTDKNPELDMRRLILFRFKKARHRLYRRLVMGVLVVAALHASYSVYSQNALKQVEDAYHENVLQKHQLLSKRDYHGSTPHPVTAAAASGSDSMSGANSYYMDREERRRLQRLYHEVQQERIQEYKKKKTTTQDML